MQQADRVLILMDVDRIRRFLIALRADNGMSVKKNWVSAKCPMAPWTHKNGIDNRPSFGVRVVPNGMSYCHCFSCNYGGQLHDLILDLKEKYGNESKESLDLRAALQLIADEEDSTGSEAFEFDDELNANAVDHEFPEWWLDSFPPVAGFPAAMLYLKSRAVTKEVARCLDLRWDGMQKRVCFPVRDYRNTPKGLHGRAIREDDPLRYRMYTFQRRNNPGVWLGESWIDPEKPVVLVESVFDLARVYCFYRNVMCPLSASISFEKIERLRKMDLYYVVSMFDGDLAGKQASQKVKAVLSPAIWKEINLPEGTDPGSTSLGDLMELMKGLIEFDDLI